MIFIHYSLISDVTITGAFGQTQIWKCAWGWVLEIQIEDIEEKKEAIVSGAHQVEDSGQCALLSASSDRRLCALSTRGRGLEEDALSAQVESWNQGLKPCLLLCPYETYKRLSLLDEAYFTSKKRAQLLLLLGNRYTSTEIHIWRKDCALILKAKTSAQISVRLLSVICNCNGIDFFVLMFSMIFMEIYCKLNFPCAQ